MTKERVTISLDAELAWAVARYARSVGRPQSRVIADMVRARLSGDAPGVAAATQSTLARRLNRMESRLARIEQDCRRMNECVLVFVRVWLEHNPPLEEDLADSLAASAKARFARYVDLVLRGVAPGRSIAGPDFDLDVLLSMPEADTEAGGRAPNPDQKEDNQKEEDHTTADGIEEDPTEEGPTEQAWPDETQSGGILTEGSPTKEGSCDTRAVEEEPSQACSHEGQGQEAAGRGAQDAGSQVCGAKDFGLHEGAP